MQTNETNIFWGREDTALGVCAALGEDFGFNPIWLRVALAVCVYLNPVATILGYLAAGIVVLATRLLVPNPRKAAEAEAPAAPAERVEIEAQPELALAA